MSAIDILHHQIQQSDLARWRAEHENASARVELANTKACAGRLLAQSDPLHELGIDREVMRVLLHYVAHHHDEKRLYRELDRLERARVDENNPHAYDL